MIKLTSFGLATLLLAAAGTPILTPAQAEDGFLRVNTEQLKWASLGNGVESAVLYGDPAKAGAAIIAAVESGEPPAFLLLGPDALAAYRYIADGRANEIAKWERLTASTDFDT